MYPVLLMAGQGAQGGSSMSLYFMIAIMVIFWLFMIRPQAKKAKEQKNFINNVQKGDKIVTIAGIHGTVSKINEDGTTIMLETNPGTYIKLEKSAISMEWTKGITPATPVETNK
ncbi:preprotein translocase subunit YajC [Haoranjiania flava]|uniref:Sec translocon accessory complex subunit YajC n=1 Tax=Haoranjiania flava TaxID=1856322 RepID=A0AAE3LJ59_9BACT|nr:preprotein translocase subunit YajC [Haoranjiania flava]MCU7693283.1 preprotein translocase subunit YajC [Haoranjiania flava]